MVIAMAMLDMVVIKTLTGDADPYNDNDDDGNDTRNNELLQELVFLLLHCSCLEMHASRQLQPSPLTPIPSQAIHA